MSYTPPASQLDDISIARLAKLHPKVRHEALALYGMACHILTGTATVRIVQGLRTFAEQNALFAQRPKVTNARGGESFHNYGLALDFALLVNGKEISWDINKDFDGDRKPDWMEVVSVFKSAGWEWGGDWKSMKDYPHFEKTFGKGFKDLLPIYNAKKVDKEGYVIF